MTTALVLGGYGAVGRHLVSDLRADGFIAYATGRDSTRADVTVDLSEPDYKSYRTALDGIDVVINTAGVEDPQLAALARHTVLHSSTSPRRPITCTLLKPSHRPARCCSGSVSRLA